MPLRPRKFTPPELLQPDDVVTTLIGEGVVAVYGSPTILELIVKVTHGGSVSATLRLPQHTGAVDYPVENLQASAAGLTGTAMPGRLDLRYGDGSIVGTLTPPDGGGPLEVELRREHPDVRPFQTPSGSAPTTLWLYRRPEDLGDGWATGTPEQVGIDVEDLRPTMQRILEGRHAFVDNVLIVRDGTLVVDEYFHNRRPDHLHTLASCTKSVTSLLVSIAVDRGEIADLHAPVRTYLTDHAGSRWIDEAYDVTVHEALSMSAGLDWNEKLPYTDERNDGVVMNAPGGWLRYVLDRELRPGWPEGRFEYQSGLSIVLGAVLRGATGVLVEDYARTHLFAPLGIDHLHWARDADGTQHTGGGLLMRPRDIAKLGQLVLQDGRWDGRRVVSSEWLKASTTQQSTDGVSRYGYQWWLSTVRRGRQRIEVIAASGYAGQSLAILPDLGAVVVTNAHDFHGDGSVAAMGAELLPVLAAAGR